MEKQGGVKLRPRRRLANSRLALAAMVTGIRALSRFPRLGGALAWVLWFTPWRVPISKRGLAKQLGWVRDAQRVGIKTDVGRISVLTAGGGPAVILVHGWGEQGAVMGGFIRPLVEAGYRAVLLDLPGHGRSDRGRTNLIDAGRAIAEVASHFEGAEAIVAHSMGANAALYAMGLGLTPKRSVLLAPSLDIDHAFQTFGHMFGLTPGVMRDLRKRIERIFGDSVWRDLRGDVLAHGLALPTLVFHDPEDPQVPFDGSVHLVKAWGSAQLVETPGAGHGPITRDPGVIEQAVSFINEGAMTADVLGRTGIEPVTRPRSPSEGPPAKKDASVGMSS